MESSSSGRFDHYNSPAKPETRAIGSMGSNAGGGRINICEVPLPNVRLEEIGRCEYFSSHKTVPPVDTVVQVREKLVGGRIAVETTRGKQTVGFLPTDANYLLGCLRDGFKYKGKVTASADSPTPRAVVDLFPV